MYEEPKKPSMPSMPKPIRPTIISIKPKSEDYIDIVLLMFLLMMIVAFAITGGLALFAYKAFTDKIHIPMIPLITSIIIIFMYLSPIFARLFALAGIALLFITIVSFISQISMCKKYKKDLKRYETNADDMLKEAMDEYVLKNKEYEAAMNKYNKEMNKYNKWIKEHDYSSYSSSYSSSSYSDYSSSEESNDDYDDQNTNSEYKDDSDDYRGKYVLWLELYSGLKGYYEDNRWGDILFCNDAMGAKKFDTKIELQNELDYLDRNWKIDSYKIIELY